MTDDKGSLDTLVQEKIDTDQDFQDSLTDLSEEEQVTAISEKKDELKNAEFSALGEKAKKSEEIAKNQEIRAKNAEAKAKKPKETETPKNKDKEEKSNEPDYAKLAFLEGKGVKHPDDQKLILDEADRLKLPLTDILEMEHIKGKLKKAHDQREAESGAPKGKGKAGGTTSGDVEYHIAKGTTPDDQELAEKVVAARIKQETGNNKFSDTLYTG